MFETMELEQASIDFSPQPDRRPKMPEPPPVQLVAVEDVTLDGVAGLEKDMDQFYIGLLRFERDATTDDLIYRAENFRLRFVIHELPQSRQDMRSIGITVPSFPDLIQRLNDLEIPFIRQKGLSPGEESLLLRDPAGNWLQLFEMKLVA
jgi:hypothetical protein